MRFSSERGSSEIFSAADPTLVVPPVGLISHSDKSTISGRLVQRIMEVLSDHSRKCDGLEPSKNLRPFGISVTLLESGMVLPLRTM